MTKLHRAVGVTAASVQLLRNVTATATDTSVGICRKKRVIACRTEGSAQC